MKCWMMRRSTHSAIMPAMMETQITVKTTTTHLRQQWDTDVLQDLQS